MQNTFEFIIRNFCYRSRCINSLQDVFCEKGVLRKKFKGKHLLQAEGCNFIKKETLAHVFFPVNFANF